MTTRQKRVDAEGVQVANDESELIRGDLRWGTIPALLRDASINHADSIALIDGDVQLTYAELRQRADAAGRAFVAAGLQLGDRVAIWAPNIWEWVVVLLGLQSAGGVLVPINTRYKGVEALGILEASRARILVTVEGFLGNDYVTMLHDAVDDESHSLVHLERIVTLRGDAPDGAVTWSEFEQLGNEVELSALDDRVDALRSGHLSDLLFTSGTTGAPKGVMCTHGQTVRAFCDWASVVGLRAEDKYLVVNPFFHAFGYKAGIVAAMTKGATLVPEAVFDVPAVMASIEREGITMIPGPPTLYQSIMNHPDFDASRVTSLRLAVTGAAVVAVSLIEDMRNVLGFETVITGYGLTEASGIAAMCRHDDDAETIASFSGRAIPGVEIMTVGDDGVATPPGEPGEVCVRGYNVMLGYFEDPVKTAETIDDEGWLHTGDIGVMDERGYLRITDRLKDMFIVGGFNVYPAEVESLLLRHPDVAQVAVIGAPDERMGEVGHAFLVPTTGATLDPDELRTWARAQMANFKVPSVFISVDSLPMNASGKVLKFELRDRVGSTAPDAQPGAPT